jgi:hypothetical protein
LELLLGGLSSTPHIGHIGFDSLWEKISH